MSEANIEIANCVWCKGITLNPQTDQCQCGNELSPISKIVPPGTCIHTVNFPEEKKITYGAVSLIERTDGRILCVWNKRYGGWGLPGGRVEEGETPGQAQERELYEETGVKTRNRTCIYLGPHGVEISPDRAAEVYVYRVVPDCSLDVPREMEVGCPVTWLTREEFLQWTPFVKIYSKIFEAHEPNPTVAATWVNLTPSL